jgi:signal transduction histidine kinase
MSLRATPQLIAGGAFAVALAALALGLILIDRSGERVLAHQQAAIARSARDYFVGFAREEGVEGLAKALNRRERSGSPDGFRYALLDKDGSVVAGADVIGELDTPDKGWGTVAEDDTPRRNWRVLATPVAGGDTLVVAEDLGVRNQFRWALVRGSALALLLALVSVLGLGLALNAVLFRRAGLIARTADRIVAGDLEARAPVHPGGDVFDHLGEAMNAMLERIEGLMTGMRAVTDSVTHDLRSPLTRMRNALVRALDPEVDEAERVQAITHAHDEAERALSTLSAIIDIANAEAGLSRDLMRPVDVCALALEMGELFGPLLEDAGQTLSVSAPDYPLVLPAHELLLRQALGNLLHNAAVHAGEGVQVRLDVIEVEPGVVRLQVRDTGAGVPADQLGRVTERFVRLDEARSRPGSGLGLSIAAACAKLHGGKLLLLSDERPGLKVAMDLRAGG